MPKRSAGKRQATDTALDSLARAALHEVETEILLRPSTAPPRPREKPAIRTGGGRTTRVAVPGPRLPAGTGPGKRLQAPVAPPASVRPARRRPRPRRAFVLLGMVIVLLTGALGVRGVVNAGFFRVRTVDVAGASLVDAGEIGRASGAEGRNLWQIDPDTARRGVEGLSGIRRAAVRRQWPRRVVVSVEERRPVVVWQIGAVAYAVDADGVVLDLVPDPAMLTIYQMDGAPGLLAGERVDADTVAVATRLRDTAPVTVGQQITRVEWTARAGLEVTTERGVRVRLGDSGDLDYKLAVWRGILDQARKDRTEIREIDLRFGDRAVYR